MSGSSGGPAADILHIALQAFEAGKLDGAAIGFETVLEHDPDSAEALYFLAAIRYQQGKNGDALPLAERAATLRPESEDCHNLLGLVLVALDKPNEAMASLMRAIACNQEFPDAYNNLGAAHEAAGDLEKAETFYRRATMVESRYAQGFSNLGRVLLATGRPVDAEDACRAALSAQPDLPDAQYNLAIAQERQGRIDASENTVETALATMPDNADLWRFLAVLRQARGDLSGGEAALREALQRQPQLAEAHDNLAGILLDQGRTDEAQASFRRALECDPGSARAHSNLLLCRNYAEDDPDTLFQAHLDWAARYAAGARQTETHAPNDRLRIGYVSGDFRRHSVAYFFEPMLRYRDGTRFETFCYANLENADAVTDRLRAQADHWRWVAGLSDDQLTAQIRQDRIDILIDLSGHTAGNRPPVFQRKPAPVQATWLGYPNTTGLDAIDYRISDTIADPEGANRHATETLVRLDTGFLSYGPPENAPDVAPTPAARNGFITFGSFNNLHKVTPQTIETWSAILARVPGSKLLIKARPLADPAVAARYRSLFAAHGVEEERLIFLGAIATPTDHLAVYNQVDIALDPLPYCGTTTTCEALWMGVPVVTLRGNRHAGRVGASLLTQVGHESLIAGNPEDYIAIAAGLASAPKLLAQDRAARRDALRASPLCDGEAFCRRMEAAFDRWTAV